MTTKQLIQAGIDGGWNKAVTKHYNIVEVDDTMIFLRGGGPHIQYDLNTLILDPKFWQAVGKSLGWNRIFSPCGSYYYESNGLEPEDDSCYCTGHEEKMYMYQKNKSEWHYNMFRMIDALAEGKSISEFIKTL